MSNIPRAEIPGLRSIMGAIALSKTAVKTAVRGLYWLQGGLTQNDIDVRDVVNALVDAVESLRSGVRDVTNVTGTGIGPSHLIYLDDKDALVRADISAAHAHLVLPDVAAAGRRITVVANGGANTCKIITTGSLCDGDYIELEAWQSATFEAVAVDEWVVTAVYAHGGTSPVAA